MDEERSGGRAGAAQPAVARLDDAVTRLLGRLGEAREEAASVAKGSEGADPRVLSARVGQLEEENANLRERVASSYEIAQRLMAKIRFLEDKK